MCLPLVCCPRCGGEGLGSLSPTDPYRPLPAPTSPTCPYIVYSGVLALSTAGEPVQGVDSSVKAGGLGAGRVGLWIVGVGLLRCKRPAWSGLARWRRIRSERVVQEVKRSVHVASAALLRLD